MKKQATDWEMFIIHITNKIGVTRISKEFYISTMADNPIDKRVKCLTRLHKKGYPMNL